MSHRTAAPLERGGGGGTEVLVVCHPTLALGRIAKLSLYRALEQREAHDFLDIPTTKRQRARDRGGAHAGARARGAHAIVAERAARGRDWAAAGARARSAPMPSAPSA